MVNINPQQQSYMELELLNQQLQQLEDTLSLYEQNIAQLESAIEALSNLEKGDEVLVPLSMGIFLSVKDIDLKNIKVAVGAGVVVDKSIDDAIKTVEKHLKELKEHKLKTIEVFDQISLKAIKLQEEIEKNH